MRYQVIIVGGGPVGVALAVDLAQRGLRVVVVEREREIAHLPKGQNLMQRTLEHFQAWGCVEGLRAARLLPPGYPIGGITAYGDLMSDYWYLPEGLSGLREYYLQENERLPQYRTEEVLRQRLVQLPTATLRPGWRASALDQDDGGVRLRIEGDAASGGGCEWLEGDYLVGCDGAHSFVREALGISETGRNFDQQMALAVFTSHELHRLLSRFPERTTYRVLHPDYRGAWLFFGRVRLGESWFFHGPVPRGLAAEAPRYVSALMERAVGRRFAHHYEHLGFWELRIESATRYRSRRCFIAGDACHSHPPYGGLGLNCGLEDVRNLAWKLAASLEGWGGEALLDSYDAERRPVFEATAREVIGAWIDAEAEFLSTYDPARDRAAFEAAWATHRSGESAPSWYEPHYEGSPVVLGASAVTGVRGPHEHRARPGHHLSPAASSRGGDLCEQLGACFTLLALDAPGGAVEEFEAAARELAVPLDIVVDDAVGERARYQARLVLVRPDQFVAWRGDGPAEDPRAVLARAAGRPGGAVRR